MLPSTDQGIIIDATCSETITPLTTTRICMTAVEWGVIESETVLGGTNRHVPIMKPHTDRNLAE